MCESFQDINIGGGGVVAVEDVYADGVMEGAYVLPDVIGDAVRV